MATRSTISIKTDDGYYRTIYCHWDGYISHNGVILVDNYDTAEKVNALIDLGNLSSLAPKLSGSELHSFDTPEKDVCVAYGRDRGDKNTEARKNYWAYDSSIQGEQYNYVFKDGEWYYNTYKGLQLVKEEEEYLAEKGKYKDESI